MILFIILNRIRNFKLKNHNKLSLAVILKFAKKYVKYLVFYKSFYSLI